jgi:RNA methyltransferase, TrmH family
MLTKNQIKELRQLHQKKFRVLQQQFLVEGVKMVKELIGSNYKFRAVYCVKTISAEFPSAFVISNEQMSQISTLTTPPGVLAVVDIPQFEPQDFTKGWTLVLNDISDPGNMGTLLRTADWFGIQQVISSENCVDVFNSKVVQASMGAIFRVSVHYADVLKVLEDCRREDIPVFAADMHGKALNEVVFPKNGLLIMGSESHGIGQDIQSLVSESITIPGKGNSESLNVSVAAGIICSRLPII